MQESISSAEKVIISNWGPGNSTLGEIDDPGNITLGDFGLRNLRVCMEPKNQNGGFKL